METTITPEKIAVALGKAPPVPDSVQFQQWEMWIEDALMLIENRATALGVDHVDQVKLDYVIREAVAKHVKRPDDATQVTVSVDDASSSRTYQSGSGRVAILDDWWDLLGLTERSGAFSVDMLGLRGSNHLPWCSLAFGALYCSCGVDIATVPIFEGGGQ